MHKSFSSTTISAISFTESFALNAIPQPADSIMEMSLAPSPTATTSSKVIPASSTWSFNTSSLDPDTKGPVTSPVNLPSSTVKLLV